MKVLSRNTQYVNPQNYWKVLKKCLNSSNSEIEGNGYLLPVISMSMTVLSKRYESQIRKTTKALP